MQNDKPQVGIILVNWNGKELLNFCIESLKGLIHTNFNITIYVVDNNSNDGSNVMVEEMYPDVVLLKQLENTGFAEGNNIGIRKALYDGMDFLWLLNNDTTVDSMSLQKLFDAYEKYGKGIYGSKIYFSKGYEFHKDKYSSHELGNVIWYAGGIIDWKNMYASHRGVDEVDSHQYDSDSKTDFITGCSLFTSKSVFNVLGMFDSRYYLYLEDVDFCIRAVNMKIPLWYIPSSRVMHKNSGSTAKPGHSLHEYYFTRNRLLIGMKYAKVRTKFALLREALRFLIAGSPVRKMAVRDYFMARFGKRYEWKNI